MNNVFDDQAAVALLNRLREEHLNGSPTAARTALSICATRAIVMPKWLAKIVNESIAKSDAGDKDNPLGFGNPKMITVWKNERLKRRNQSLRLDFERLSEMFGENMSKGKIIKWLSETHHISVKVVEKSIYPSQG